MKDIKEEIVKGFLNNKLDEIEFEIMVNRLIGDMNDIDSFMLLNSVIDSIV